MFQKKTDPLSRMIALISINKFLDTDEHKSGIVVFGDMLESNQKAIDLLLQKGGLKK